MAGFDLDHELTEEMIAVRDMCHQFAVEVMRPVGRELDAMPNPESVIAKDSPLWDAIAKFKKLGLGGPDAYGEELSPAQRALMHCVVLEELCWGDVGLAITMELGEWTSFIAKSYGNQPAYEFFSQREDIMCLALTEPNHGSDHVAFTEPIFTDKSVKPDCRVRREGDEYVINGKKADWVSTAPIATACSLFCTFEGSEDGIKNGAIFLMPLDLPGISRGKSLDKLGQRTLPQGALFFDEVRVPKKFMMMEGPNLYPVVWEFTLRDANIAMAQEFVGVGRAAYDCALEYAKERVQGGVPIFQHQSVKSRLFNMFTKLEASRAYVRRVSIANVSKEGGVPYPYAAAAKVLSTQTAFELASEALQIFGGNGLSREYPIEKIFRDARASLIEDGENNVLGLMAAARL